VESFREACPRFSTRIVDENFSTVKAHREVAIRHRVDATDLGIDAGRSLDLFDREGVGPLVGAGQGGSESEKEK
jgi:hypothetical protein